MRNAHRLAPVAAAVWAAALVLVHVPAAALATLISAIALGAVAVAFAFARRSTGVAALAGVCLAGVALVAASVVVGEASRHPPSLTDAISRGLVEATFEVTTQMHRSASTTSDAERYRVGARLLRIGSGEDADVVDVPVVAFVAADADELRLGATLSGRAALVPTDEGDDAVALAFVDDGVEVVAPPPAYLAWAAQLRAGFLALCDPLPSPGGDLLPGLAVGDTTAVSDALDADMKASSLSHLTAVSGANCSLVTVAAFVGLGLLGVRRIVRTAAAALVLLAFVVLVTPEASVVRAATMALIALAVHAVGRPAAGLPVLSLAVIGLLVASPWLATDAGFALSALATAGLLTLARPLATVLSRQLPSWIAAAVAIPLAAQAACQPVLILLSGSIPLYGVLANILAAPAAPAGTVVGLLACLLAGVPVVGPFLAWIGYVPAAWVAGVAEVTSSLPGASLPWIPGVSGGILLAVVTALVLAVALVPRWRRKRSGLAAVALLCVLLGAYSGVVVGGRIASALDRPADWTVAACDVGQGDALLVRGDDGSVSGIDTGPEPESYAACLDLLGIDHLDLLVLTHYDIDHVGGVEAIIGRVSSALVQEPSDAGDGALLDDLRGGGADVVIARAGMTGVAGAIAYEVLWPVEGAEPGNAASVTLDVRAGGMRMLFLGDLGEDSEREILRRHRVGTGYDLVKVAHHGSADQDAALYARAAAAIGVISVGADNGYGHPTQTALDMLAAAGSTVFRTDRDGLILVLKEASRIRVWCERGQGDVGDGG